MISIIICSINKDYLDGVSKSIEDTIGVAYEIICIDNKIEKLNIAQAYNKGAKLAVYDILIFVHEDVLFRTDKWGKNLINHFDFLDNVGVIGIAGSKYQPICPTSWFIPNENVNCYNILVTEVLKNKTVHGKNNSDKVSKVFSIDGVFLVMKKNVFNELLFDEGLEGFHGYDASISLRSALKYNNYFVPDILLEHFSVGNPDSTTLKNNIFIFDELYKYLPLYKNNTIIFKTELVSYFRFCTHLKNLKEQKTKIIFIKVRFFLRILRVFIKFAISKFIFLK